MKPKYHIRRGFSAPTPGNPNPVYEVWRRKTLFRAEKHILTCATRPEAAWARDCLNSGKRY